MYEHARNWVEMLLGTKELNKRFIAMPETQDLRHFGGGVTTVKVWTGRGSRDMMRQFMPIAVDAQAPPDFARMVRSLLDFSYLAHSAQLLDIELTEMDRLLAVFHQTKRAVVDAKLVQRLGAFDRLAKLHMLSHYTYDIRELGVPDGYSTETPEHLHIVYVKIPWRMSNWRDPLPQMEALVARTEAIRMQRTVIDECYGKQEGTDDAEIRRFAAIDRAGMHADGDLNAGVDSDMEREEVGDDGDDTEVEGNQEPSTRSGNIHYPRPVISVARQPTARRVPAHVLMGQYGASDVARAISLFISTISPSDPSLHDLSPLLPSDRFNVWHKAVLKHVPLPFAPAQPCHRDMIRAQPPVHDNAGRVTKPGVFDTALFSCDPVAFGLNRYRAGRVRAIFTLPSRLHHVHSGPLVFLDFFKPFESNPTSTHGLHRTMPLDSGSCASLVLPLGWLGMSCHLAPDFSSPPSPTTIRQRFLFNDFHNHFTYLLMAYWRHVDPAQRH
ncbi:Zn-finger protein [Ceratobasidium sp. AG-Ba]|nr:Zn-finger protein [Ceratobasidium sp. AG-Ba]